MASKKLIPGIDYECFDWTDYIGGPYSYVQKFEQGNASDILQIAARCMDRRIVNALTHYSKLFVDDLRNGEKSFYGKARVVHVENRSGGFYEILISYNTAVAMVDAQGYFIRLWNGYSATTARHIHAFRLRYGLRGIGKADWLLLPIGKRSADAANKIA